MSLIRFPAEWEPHAATWLGWPHDVTTFPYLTTVEKVWAQMIHEIAKGETVKLLAHSRLHERIQHHIGRANNVVIHDVQAADVWLRDTGPIFIKEDGNIKATCWGFNAWGNKYEELLADVGLNEKIGELAGVPNVKVPMILEGGSIDSDGSGLCLTTEQCLLNKNRNPTLNKRLIEEKLAQHLGFNHFLWLGQGIEGDDTDGHVDDLARFVNEKTVVYAMAEKGDANYSALKENEERLKRYAKIHRLDLQPLPMPPRLEFEGNLLPASYCNFYIANACVLVPTFNVPQDNEAVSILREFFPERKVVELDCRYVVEGFGALHCVTQQQPKY